MLETYMWYDEGTDSGIICHISYYLNRPVCQALYIDGKPVPRFTGYISWLGQSDFILEPHRASVGTIRSMKSLPDKWEERFLVPKNIGTIWSRGLEPVE